MGDSSVHRLGVRILGKKDAAPKNGDSRGIHQKKWLVLAINIWDYIYII